jgi:hypothetical protein
MTTQNFKKHKHGFIRPSDGRIFYKYQKRKIKDGTIKIYEKWLSPEAFEKTKKRREEYRKIPQNRERYLRQNKERYLKNKLEFNRKQKAWREDPKNKQKIKEKKARYYRENFQKIKKGRAIYYQKNKDRFRERRRKYEQEQYQTNPQFALSSRIRSRIRISIKKANVQKSTKTIDLIGCSYEFLRKHIESQFREGMAWDKPNSFHIDHIRPLASFDLTDPEQQKSACHWTNLQPLYPEENWKKGTKMPCIDLQR